jgi:hypothetical protein
VKRLLTLALLATLVSPALAAPKKGKKAEPPAPVVVEPPPPPPDPEAWRATAPAPGAEGKWAPPAAKMFTLANGVRVIMKPTTFKKDEVVFSATSPGGSSLVTDADYPEAAIAASWINNSREVIFFFNI